MLRSPCAKSCILWLSRSPLLPCGCCGCPCCWRRIELAVALAEGIESIAELVRERWCRLRCNRRHPAAIVVSLDLSAIAQGALHGVKDGLQLAQHPLELRMHWHRTARRNLPAIREQHRQPFDRPAEQTSEDAARVVSSGVLRAGLLT